MNKSIKCRIVFFFMPLLFFCSLCVAEKKKLDIESRITHSAVDLYDKYKHDEKILTAYLEAYGDGFKLGIQGKPAHLLAPRYEVSVEAASINGFIGGYTHGLSFFREISGIKEGYRNFP